MKRADIFLTENEDVIDREVTENELETNWNTLKEVIDEFPDDLDDDDKKQTAGNEN